MKVDVELRGAKELASFLQQAPKEVGVKAGKGGIQKAAPRLRTLLRRAAPKKTGRLRSIIQAKMGKGPVAWIGLKGKAAGIYYTLEYGRGAYRRRSGHSYAASPQMARFAWFKKAWETNKGYIAQLTIDATRASLAREVGRLITKTKAPIKYRKGR